jgi:hypothetical protein
VLRELSEEGARQLERLHRGYLWAAPPTRKGQEAKEATAAYRMRMLTLELWSKWPKIRLHLSRPELGLDGTNNASERGISKSKVRYKSMRGYKSMGGMKTTGWLYPMALQRRRRARDLNKEMAASSTVSVSPKQFLEFAHRLWDSHRAPCLLTRVSQERKLCFTLVNAS